MKLKVQLIDKEYTLKRYSKFEELIDIFNQIEPQFNLESFTYYDEEHDLITISKDEDYNCFLNSSISIIQANGKYGCQELQLESERNLKLIQNFKQKTIIFNERMKNNLIDQKMYYEHYLNMTHAIQKMPKEQQPLEQEKNLILMKIEEQERRIQQNKKLNLKTDLIYHFISSNISQIVNQCDQNINYGLKTRIEFDRQLECLQNYLADQFFQVYLKRYNKLIEIREKQLNGLKKLAELKNDLKEIQYQIRRSNQQLRLRETYFIQGIYAIKNLQRKV